MKRALFLTILASAMAGAAIGLAASTLWPIWAAALAGWGSTNALVVAWA